MNIGVVEMKELIEAFFGWSYFSIRQQLMHKVHRTTRENLIRSFDFCFCIRFLWKLFLSLFYERTIIKTFIILCFGIDLKSESFLRL